MRNRSVTYSTEAAFHALADPTRRAVLDLLRKGCSRRGRLRGPFRCRGPRFRNTCACCAAPTWCRRSAKGGIACTSSIQNRLKAVDSWLQQYRVFWEANLNSLKAFVEAEHARETAGLGGGTSDVVKRSKAKE